MKKERYRDALESLKGKGLTLVESKPGLFGVKVVATYPIGEKTMEIRLDYSSFSGAMRAEFFIPYSPVSVPFMEEYDRVFPEEKNAWGKSSPKFEQAIVDYMRGQSHSTTKVELREHKTLLYIAFSVGASAHGEAGFAEALSKVSFEMRKGMIHGDVLFHMFAY